MHENDLTDTDIIAICSHFLNAINYLYYKNVISIESIISQSIQRPALFINFYPEIEQYDSEYAMKRSELISSEIEDELLEFFKFVKSNPEQHIKYRNENYHPSKLHKSIRDDDIDTFQTLLSQNNYTVNHRIQHSYYERTSTCDRNVSLIQIAAVYGSLNVFKFLWMQNDIFLDENLQFYAYSGRNFEIIHICEEKCPFLNVVDYAISTHQIDLVNYFLDNFEDKIESSEDLEKVEDDDNPFKKLPIKSLQKALISLNYEIILPSLKKIVYIVNNIENDSRSFVFALFFGSPKVMLDFCLFDVDLFKFIYNLNRDKYLNFRSNARKYSSALFRGAYTVVKYMLDQIDIETLCLNFDGLLNTDKNSANIILDIFKANENKLADIKRIFDSSLIFKALMNYDEEVVVKMIMMFDLFKDKELISEFVKVSCKYLSIKMIISLCKKLSPILDKNELVDLVDCYAKDNANDDFISALNEIKNQNQ